MCAQSSSMPTLSQGEKSSEVCMSCLDMSDYNVFFLDYPDPHHSR